MMKKLLIIICILFIALSAVSCITPEKQQERLTPQRSTVSIRFDDIKEQVEENPVKAIDLIGSYREM
jgi:PBP1b-binding outer membrane lipoprotein LpoB